MTTSLLLTTAAPPDPTVEIILGADVASILARAGGAERHPLLTRALKRELAKIWPSRPITVIVELVGKSFVRSADEAAPLAEAMPAIQAVLFDAHRYEWDDATLATPLEAIDYLLTRCQSNADLGHLVGPGVQSFRLLCEAEAGLLGEPLADVLARRGKSLTTEPRRYLLETELDRAREHEAGPESESPSSLAAEIGAAVQEGIAARDVDAAVHRVGRWCDIHGVSDSRWAVAEKQVRERITAALAEHVEG